MSYESGTDNVPRFDAHIEMYSKEKSIRKTPYVGGLPTTMHIRENVDGVYKGTLIRRTYEDSYTIEMKEFYDFVVHGAPLKTTAQDAKLDLKIFQMIMSAEESALTNGHGNDTVVNAKNGV